MTQATPSTAPLTVVLVHGAFADASSWTGVFRAVRGARLEDLAFLGRRCYRRQGGWERCHPFHGQARRSDDHRGRGIPRDHDLAATGRHRRDPERGRRRQRSEWAASAVSWSLPEPRGSTYADRYRRPEWCIGTSPAHPSI